MQGQKSRNSSSGPSPVTPRSTRTHKSAASDSDSATPPHSTGRLSVDRSPKPKIPDYKSPRSPLTEKRATKASELQQQLAQAQDELKKTKEQLAASEAAKAQALQDLQDAKKLAEETKAKLERTSEITESQNAQIFELQKAFEDVKERDRAWQAKLEDLESKHSMDVAALISTGQELQRVKHELSLSYDSRTMAFAQVEQANMEIESLKHEIANLKMPEPNLSEAYGHLENLRFELKEAKSSEVRALMAARDANFRVEEARMEADTAKAEQIKALESLNVLTTELAEANVRLEKTKYTVSALSQTAEGLKAELEKTRLELFEAKKMEEHMRSKDVEGQDMMYKAMQHLESELRNANTESERAKIELENAYEEIQKSRLEAEQLRALFQAAEQRFETMLREARADVDHAMEAAMRAKLEADEHAVQSNERECKLMEALRAAGAKANETKGESEKNEMKVVDLKASLMDKETELQNILEENETLKNNETQYLEKIAQLEKELAMTQKMETQKVETKNEDEDNEKITEALERVANANAREQEALEKLRVCEVELENSTQRASRSLEQLEAAQAANLAMETEMKRLKIQTEQWRKAADAAASVLAASRNGELNGKVVERSASLLSDSDVLSMKFASPMRDDMDSLESSPTSKKKKAVLKKLGDMWKKRNQK